jgi:iron complex outermembrane receptor protein
VLNTTTGAITIAPVSPYQVSCTNFSNAETCDNQNQWQISQEFQASGTIDRIKYVGGLYYFEENVGENDPQAFTIPAPTGIPSMPYVGVSPPLSYSYSAKAASYAGYGEVVYTPPVLDDQFQLTGGMRFTRDERSEAIRQPAPVRGSTSSSNLSGDATIKYSWTPDIQAYFRFANAYKSGGFNGRDVSSYPDPARPYAPEVANSYEIGTHSEFLEHHLRVNADVFYTNYSNQQIATIVSTPTNPAVTETINAGASTYLGGELELTAIIADAWQVDVNFGYTDPKYQVYNTYPNGLNGPPVNIAQVAKFPYFSRATMDLGVQYAFPPLSYGDLSVRVDFAYKSGVVFGSNPIANPLNDIVASQALNDLGANITLANVPLNYHNGSMQFSLYGKNLLDQHQRIQGVDFSSLAAAPPGGFGVDIYNRPRVIGFNAGVKF